MRVTVAAADASGGEMIAPNKKAIGQVSVGTSHLMTRAMPHTVNTTRPNAKNEIGRILRLNSVQDVK